MNEKLAIIPPHPLQHRAIGSGSPEVSRNTNSYDGVVVEIAVQIRVQMDWQMRLMQSRKA